MGEGRIKSAIELAMEKISEMPQLDTNEIRELQNMEALDRGRDLAQKLLKSTGRRFSLEDELQKEDSAVRPVVEKGLLLGLAESLGLDPKKNQASFEAVATVKPDLDLDGIKHRTDTIISSYQQELKRFSSEMGQRLKTELKKQGIAGTAVYPNLAVNPDWQKAVNEVGQQFTKAMQAEIDRLKQILGGSSTKGGFSSNSGL